MLGSHCQATVCVCVCVCVSVSNSRSLSPVTQALWENFGRTHVTGLDQPNLLDVTEEREIMERKAE